MPGDQIALITGGNKGLGFEIGRQLGERGIRVLSGARDEARGQEAANVLAAEGLNVGQVRIDVTDQDTIAAAAREIDQRHGRLDILVNNAGITGGFRGVPSEVTVDQLRQLADAGHGPGL
jgi:NAD(P)-dependent dehydrogenase (short-subunit alcohol dehydrogenase family)